MSINVQKVEAIATALLGVVSEFVPGANVAADVVLVQKLLTAGADLNGLLADIRNQTEADAVEVWDKVKADFAGAVEGFDASIAAHATA